MILSLTAIADCIMCCRVPEYCWSDLQLRFFLLLFTPEHQCFCLIESQNFRQIFLLRCFLSFSVLFLLKSVFHLCNIGSVVINLRGA